MKKRHAKLISLFVICLFLIGGGIWLAQNTALVYYHGLKTEHQLKSTRVVKTKTNFHFDQIELDANLPVIIKRGAVNKVQVFAQQRQNIKLKVKHAKLTVSSAPDVRVHPISVPFFKQAHQSLTQNYIMITVKDGRLKKLIRNDADVVGDLTFEKLRVDHLQLNGSGNLTFDHFKTNHQILINSNHGQVSFHQVQATMLNLTTHRGLVRIDHSNFYKRPSQITSDMSSIQLDTNQWNKLWSKTSEGNVWFQHQDSKHLFKILTNDGNITGTIDAPQLALINYYSDNGSVDVFHNLPTEKARYYSFYSDNGSIRIRRGELTFNK